MYNRVHRSQNKHLTLNSYITGINKSILLKKHYENILYEKLVNELHSWIENHPNVVHPPNVKYQFFIKIGVTLVEK